MEERLRRLEEAISQIVEVVQMVCEKVDHVDEVLDSITSNKITDRLESVERDFGEMVTGFNDIIDGRRKREYTEGLRANKPELGRYENIGKRFGIDVFDTVAEKTFGMPDEEREGAIGAMMNELKEKFDDLIEALETHNTHEAAETPKEEAAEHEPKEGSVEIEIETEKGKDPKLMQIARAMRGRS